MSSLLDVVLLSRGNVFVTNHLTDERVLQLLKDSDAEFSKQELQHLSLCRDCQNAVIGAQESLLGFK